jgi:F0F1-type ATP synthase assembly protein I
VSPRRDGDNRNPWATVARYSEIGFIVPAAVVLGLVLGKLLDHWLHTSWLYIAGVIFGAVVGFIEMIRMATSSMHDKE